MMSCAISSIRMPILHPQFLQPYSPIQLPLTSLRLNTLVDTFELSNTLAYDKLITQNKSYFFKENFHMLSGFFFRQIFYYV